MQLHAALYTTHVSMSAPADEIISEQITDSDSQEDAPAKPSPQSVSIITLGKTGSGKTSLASAIAGKSAEDQLQDKAGWKTDTRGNRSVCIQLDEVVINVVDTHGMRDTSQDTLDEETLEIVSKYINNETEGVIIVCIEMHQRVNESTLEILVQLDKKFGRDIWKHVVIASTKADRYEENKWLESKRFGKSSNTFLAEKFAEVIKEQKESLKEFFTALSDQVSPSCYLGMTEEEFDQLMIPIVPSSQLNELEMNRMKQVGYGYWFDQLIVKCFRSRVHGGSP